MNALRLPRRIRRSTLYLGLRDLYRAEKCKAVNDGLDGYSDRRIAISSVLCTLMHFCDSHDVRWQDVLDTATYQRAIDLIEDKNIVMFDEELEDAA